MDEILIEEKRYVSSKQAAKVTGYAKDYIGQLCREGRVPARLVGRSWYVLESAIQDHRFGTQDSDDVSAIETKETEQKTPTKTWEFPRYEATHDEILPSVNRLRDVEADSEDHEGLEDAPKNLHESWQNWFDNVASSEVSDPKEENDESVVEEEAEVVSIPLHVISQGLPRRELLPKESVWPEEMKIRKEPARRPGNRMTGAIQMAGAFVAVASIALALIGTGYFDEYILSSGQVEMISGAVMYNK